MNTQSQAVSFAGVQHAEERVYPLSKLKKSPRNVRKVAHTEADIEARAASIRAKGLISPLVVEPELGADGAETGFALVTAGEGRRLALRLLAKRKVISKTTPVRCLVVINTDRRTYHLDLRSAAGKADVVARISWRYPVPTVVVVSAPPAPVPTSVAAEPARPLLNFGYRIKGARVAWRPVRVFDDGRRTYVEFAPGFSRQVLPPLFGLGPDGKTATLLNTHVEDGRLVVDGRLERAELRLGLGRWARRVVIVREAGQ